MILFEMDLLKERPLWRPVLAAYRAQELSAVEVRAKARKQAEAAAKLQEHAAGDVPADGAPQESSSPFPAGYWVPRVDTVDGVPDEDLSQIHGKLIAFGFVNFKLLGRAEGVVYQLTDLGKRGAELPVQAVDAEDQSEDFKSAAEQAA